MLICWRNICSVSKGQCTQKKCSYVPIHNVLHRTNVMIQNCEPWGIANIMGLHMGFKRETMCLNLSRCLRPDIPILTSVRMAVGNKSNNGACEGLSRFEGRCGVLVLRCMLRGDTNNSREYFLFLACPYPVFLVKSHGIVTFSEIWRVFMKDVKKCVCLLMVDVCINSSEIHMTGFLGGFFCTSAHRYISLSIVVWDCRQNIVTWGGIFGWCVFCYGNKRVICNHLVICVHTNKIY